MFSKLFSKLGRLVKPKKAEEATDQELHSAERRMLLPEDISIDHEEYYTNEKTDPKVREFGKLIKNLVRRWHIRIFILQLKLERWKEINPAGKRYPSLRTEIELELDVEIKPDKEWDEEEIEQQIKCHQIVKEFWRAFDPSDPQQPRTDPKYSSPCYVNWKQQVEEHRRKRLEERKLLNGAKIEIHKFTPRPLPTNLKSIITNNELPSYPLPTNSNSMIANNELPSYSKITNNELPSYHLATNSSSTCRYHHIESLIEKRKAEIQLLERQLEEENREMNTSLSRSNFADRKN
ncbi:hypothetical protein NHQ30_007077 [Ciborinia camelliae]|nr:hypothetical protein NHQ30_007077 [Ciborinia camelliae]